MNTEKLRQYAEVAVRMGVNVQPGQLLVIKGPVDCAGFIRLCVEEGYKAGAAEVIVDWQDELVSRSHYEYGDLKTLCHVSQWIIDRQQEFVDRGYCILHIDSEIPGVMEGIDENKIQKVVTARRKALDRFQDYTMSNKGQWSIVAIPNPQWAMKVFPELTADEAVEALWDAILASVRIGTDKDPIALWKEHNEKLSHNNRWLNEQNFKALHFVNGLGTDLTVELPQGHVWAGGCEKSQKGVIFNPNMPTEENFTMPKRTGVNGRVVATKPLSYQGKLIRNFEIEFKEGKAVRWKAEESEEALSNLIRFDEGSCYLGEVALIDVDTPISRSGILFYDTLFDENASCHLALGRAYPMNLENFEQMSEQEMRDRGCNFSMVHVDFMFGNEDMQITGIHQDGSETVFFSQGHFIF